MSLKTKGALGFPSITNRLLYQLSYVGFQQLTAKSVSHLFPGRGKIRTSDGLHWFAF